MMLKTVRGRDQAEAVILQSVVRKIVFLVCRTGVTSCT
eukprot:COSAG05_NODE_17953_length_316_cov_0.953917_1_plen_37_part_01